MTQAVRGQILFSVSLSAVIKRSRIRTCLVWTMSFWQLKLLPTQNLDGTSGSSLNGDDGHHIKSKDGAQVFNLFLSDSTLLFRKIEAIVSVILLSGVSRVIKAEVLMHFLRERCNSGPFCGIDLTKEVCQVGGWVGGPTQDDFPGHVYPSISEKSFSSSFPSMENKAEWKGRWSAQWKAYTAKDNKRYVSCLDLGFNVVAIWVWNLISSYNNSWLFFSRRTLMFWKSHYEVIVLF